MTTKIQGAIEFSIVDETSERVVGASFIGKQKDGVFVATATFVTRGRTLSVIRTTGTGANGRLVADVTTGHVPAK